MKAFKVFLEILLPGIKTKILFLSLVFFFIITDSGFCKEGNACIDYVKWLKEDSIIVSQSDPEKLWLFNIRDKSFSYLPYSGKSCAFSLTGEKVVWMEFFDEIGDGFRYGNVKGPFSKAVPVPAIVDMKPPPLSGYEADKYAILYKETDIIWISEHELLINQKNTDTIKVKCRIYNVLNGTWQNTDKCIDNGYRNIAIEAGPNGLMAIYHSIEGAPVVSVVKWSRDKGMQDIGFKILHPYYLSTMEVCFLADSLSIHIVTPSVLEDDVHGNDGDIERFGYDTVPWRLYSWGPNRDKYAEPGKTKSLVLIKSGLPPFISPNPVKRETMAWPRKDKKAVCVGNPESDYTCTPIPEVDS